MNNIKNAINDLGFGESVSISLSAPNRVTNMKYVNDQITTMPTAHLTDMVDTIAALQVELKETNERLGDCHETIAQLKKERDYLRHKEMARHQKRLDAEAERENPTSIGQLYSG